MKVCMIPGPKGVASESGINAVARAYGKYLPEFGIEFVRPDQNMDLLAIHAGMTNKFDSSVPIVAHLHGLYWTEDYQAEKWEYKANRDVISSLLHARQITVPSTWVAETLRRDVRIDPYVIGHGIDWQEWEPVDSPAGYILWNKNRAGDVCDPSPVSELAKRFAGLQFVSTFATDDRPNNVHVTGVMEHAIMKQTVLNAGVYLATTKETFGIGILEAMASAVPVLGWRHGGVVDLIEHGVSGYLAEPGNYEDLAQGLSYCLKYRKQLGANGRVAVQQYDWMRVASQVAAVYKLAASPSPATVSVIIPCYNYGNVLSRAVESVIAQSTPAEEIVIVDDGSTDNTPAVAEKLVELYPDRIRYMRTTNMGVANARNIGISAAHSKYICCLDADDEIGVDFLKVCVAALEGDPSLGLAYTRLMTVDQEGRETISEWPSEYNYDRFLQGQNQVPTCCVFRRDLWARLGGYRQRYAPEGAGAEDAEFWLRMGALGHKGKLASERPLFLYHLGGRVSGNIRYREENWRAWHPWVKDSRHPFASAASPAEFAHPVRQYDTPVVSVVIPVGPGHIAYLSNALDSLESQSIRSWEAILVNDSGNPIPYQLLEAYPYLKLYDTGFDPRDGEIRAPRGAGVARNIGARAAKGQFLLFLDADDWLEPEALYSMLQRMAEGDVDIVYTDYFGHATLEKKEITNLQREGRIKSSREDGSAVIIYSASDYDCKLAQSQPAVRDGTVYVWCLVSSLIKKSLHNHLGGFDESMESWEDWDYWIRAARQNACFARVESPLVNYRFSTGSRREVGIQNRERLLSYMSDKREKESAVMCGCSNKSRNGASSTHNVFSAPLSSSRRMATSGTRERDTKMASGEMVLVTLNDKNIGDHPVIGYATKTNYGHRSTGEEFYMYEQDVNAKPNKFVRVQANKAVAMAAGGNTEPTAPPPPPPPSTAVTPKPQGVVSTKPEDGGVGTSTSDAGDSTETGPNTVDNPEPGSVPATHGDQKPPEDMSPNPEPTVPESQPTTPKDKGVDLSSRVEILAERGIINSTMVQALLDGGVQTLQDALNLGEDGLEALNGIGSISAKKILQEAGKEVNKDGK